MNKMDNLLLELPKDIQAALKVLNFKELTPVQTQVLPIALQGENLMVQSHTGTGKTHAFLLPIFQKIDREKDEVQVVITAPSRELADQIYQAANQLNNYLEEPVSIVCYVGGTDKQRQIERLSPKNQPQMVIGTPGRIFDLMFENALHVQTTRIFVVDEADMTLDLGFLPIVDEIASRMPQDLQMMVFSATIPQEIQVFLNKYMPAMNVIRLNPGEVISSNITNYLINVRGRDKLALLHELLTIGQPYLVLIFANTIEYVDEIHRYLMQQGMKVAKIHGDISSRERKRVMRQIRNMDYQFVVATDLAARGIDIPGTSMIVNMEIPTDLNFFVHRIGRTGRHNLSGEAYTLIAPDDMDDIDSLRSRGIPFEWIDIVQGDFKAIDSKPGPVNTTVSPQYRDDKEINRIINQTHKKKVKPGYKRKMKEQIKSRQQHLRRQKNNKKR